MNSYITLQCFVVKDDAELFASSVKALLGNVSLDVNVIYRRKYYWVVLIAAEHRCFNNAKLLFT